MIREFKEFISRGNVLDLAVAVIIGAAFATITSSLTDDIVMPVIGWLFGGVDFSSYFIRLGPIPDAYAGSPDNYAALKQAGVAMIGIGQFIAVLINFLILAFVVFLLVRTANRLIRKPEAPTDAPNEIALLTDIRDELRKR